ncbi:hypothetical protein [Sedimentibacter sp.]|uniref:hypothetical protein n=1 Tax=Sedimentibacter sp. TaxID=1960295 RepID=UPI0028A0FF7D|nr:hypothetical protein [Sedimentibacter sp.]
MKKEQDKARGCKLPLAVTADGSADRILRKMKGFGKIVNTSISWTKRCCKQDFELTEVL